MPLNLLLAAATALLLILTFPKFDFAFLAPFALAPLLIALGRSRTLRSAAQSVSPPSGPVLKKSRNTIRVADERGSTRITHLSLICVYLRLSAVSNALAFSGLSHHPLKRAPRRFLLGWVAGILYWAGACYWIHFVLAVHGEMAEWAAWLGYALFCLIKGLHLGVFALLAGFLLARRGAALTVPALWVAIEWTHTHLGFAWLDLGNAGIGMSVLARLAPYTGVYGLSFAFALAATALALAVLRRPRIELAPLVALLAVALLPALPPPRPGTKSALLVQPNVSETAAWTTQWIRDMQVRLDALTFQAAYTDPGPSLIVWPEAPMPVYYFEDPDTAAWVAEAARRNGAYLIVNATPHDARGAPLNSALLVSPQGVAVGRYDKMNLVPFGEYVPWPFHALVAKVSTESGDFAAGARQVTLAAGPHRIGAFICYESVFPDFVRRFARDGAELLVNISNDGWYGNTAAREQHLQIVRMRAAENRRWILRATNDGITATIDPAGRLSRDLPPYVQGAVRTGYSWVSATTFYGRHGDWFVLLCALIAAAGLVAGISPRRTSAHEG